MAQLTSIEPATAFRITLDTRFVCLTDEQFCLLCRDNPDLRFELSAEGELIVMSPTYPDTGWKAAKITYRLAQWTEQDGTGICFDSSTGFTLPNGAKRSPDASWMPRKRWDALSPEDRKKMTRVCPDFVLELRSATDTVSQLQQKMTEYLQNGARLGWLLDPFEKTVYIYRPERNVERLENPGNLSGEDTLPGFQFNFQEILPEEL